MELIRRLVTEEEGQGITEYALILGLVVLGIWVAVRTSGLGTSISTLFGNVVTEVDGCTSGNCGGT
jgi:pilus assembly protein Flp/PilA